jgi:hypothetical protein
MQRETGKERVPQNNESFPEHLRAALLCGGPVLRLAQAEI